ncbi:DsbA family oxidoreductase [Streptomyces sp. NPDC093085]|uniref:DsbA family oxidoreductase n=1 Tax=Streptomyces sp. NPDC093085 TaxID=3155068 RepID=UPI00342ECD21
MTSHPPASSTPSPSSTASPTPTPSPSPTIDLDLWSDFVCAHCYYGTRRVTNAIAAQPDPGVFRLRWRSFELDPRPAGQRPTGDLYDYLARFNGSREAGRAAMEMIGAIATADGLPFDADAARPGNTVDAHRLIHLAGEDGRQTEVAQRFYAAYWTEGLPIAEHTALLEVAEEAGLDPARAREVLAGDAFTAEVAEDQELAMSIGIMGVPTVVVAGRWALSAGMPLDTLSEQLKRMTAEALEA